MTIESPEPPHAKPSGHRWLDFLVGIAALITSAMSIFMALENSHSMQNLVHANSWPFLQISSSNTAEDNVTRTLVFDLKNAGTGPARIYYVQFLVNGRSVSGRNPLVSIATACCNAEFTPLASAPNRWDQLGEVITSPLGPSVLAANDRFDALRWQRKDSNAALWDAVDQARQRGDVAVRACYCSVFDECWIAETNTLPQQLSGLCPTHTVSSALRG